jgi:hypothetical protein
VWLAGRRAKSLSVVLEPSIEYAVCRKIIEIGFAVVVLFTRRRKAPTEVCRATSESSLMEEERVECV